MNARRQRCGRGAARAPTATAWARPSASSVPTGPGGMPLRHSSFDTSLRYFTANKKSVTQPTGPDGTACVASRPIPKSEQTNGSACGGRKVDEGHGRRRPAVRAAVIEEELALAACGLARAWSSTARHGFPTKWVRQHRLKGTLKESVRNQCPVQG